MTTLPTSYSLVTLRESNSVLPPPRAFAMGVPHFLFFARLEMPKTLVDCGNCGPDFNSIRQMVTAHFEASVLQTHGAADTLELLRSRKVDLVTVNRKLDRDYSDGLEIIKQIKADPDTKDIPVMLVTNYDEHQQTAIKEGATYGFGKLEIGNDETVEKLKPYLAG